jgi:hypothetical protein
MDERIKQIGNKLICLIPQLFVVILASLREKADEKPPGGTGTKFAQPYFCATLFLAPPREMFS